MRLKAERDAMPMLTAALVLPFPPLPLHAGSPQDHVAAVEYLLSRIQGQPQRTKAAESALLDAAHGDHEALIKVLVRGHGVQVDARDEDGETPLMLATREVRGRAWAAGSGICSPAAVYVHARWCVSLDHRIDRR